MNKKIVSVENVSYSYPGGIKALDSASISINEKDIYAIIGSNGSGKSTMLQIIAGLIHPASGSVFFRNEEITEKKLTDAMFLRNFRESVGFIFQNSDVQLFCPSVMDELLFGPLQTGVSKDEAYERSMQILGMLGIEYLKDRPTHMLSGGEKKRVAIGSVLTMNPDLLIFDEPTAALDPKTQSFLIELILSLNSAGKTILMATHNLMLVDHLQPRVAVLSEDHRVERTGRFDEIITDEELLIKVNLIHESVHRHGKKIHSHKHSHYLYHKH